MIPQIRRTFNIREVKGGYVLSVSSYDGNNYLLNGTNTNESIHPGIDDLMQAIRFELTNPHPEKYEAKKDNVFGLGNTPLEAVHILVSALKASKA